MDEPNTRRFRFGIRGLLLLVLVCAIAIQVILSQYSVLERNSQRVRVGMTRQQALFILGTPQSLDASDDKSITWTSDLYIEDGRVWKSQVLVEAWCLGGTVRMVDIKKDGKSVMWRGR